MHSAWLVANLWNYEYLLIVLYHQGLDLPDIYYVVQWKVTCDLSSLWQRFGRGGRGQDTQAVAILLVEKKYFDVKPGEGATGVNAVSAKRKCNTTLAEEPPGKKRATRGKVQAVDQPSIPDGPVAEASKRKRGNITAEVDEDAPTRAKRSRLAQASVAAGSHTTTDSTSPSSNTPNVSLLSHPGREGPQLDVEAKRKIYHEAENDSTNRSKQAGKTKREVVAGSAMDEFINARTREGLVCRRDVLNIYFDNDKSGECLAKLRSGAHGTLMG